MIQSDRLKAINLGVRKTRVLRSEILKLFELPELIVKPFKKVVLVEQPISKANCYTVEEIYISKKHIEKAYRLAKGGEK